MIFGPTPLAEAEGCILAHTVRLPGQVLKKGTRLDAPLLAALLASGRQEVIAARLEPGDVGEDEAADQLAAALLGPGMTRSSAGTGRVNLFAAAPGLLVLEAAAIERLNATHESLTIATLPNHTVVEAREMLATIKVIPFAAPGAVLGTALAEAAEAAPLLRVAPFRPLKVGLVLSTLPGLKPSILDATVAATEARITSLGGTLLPALRCPHETPAIAACLQQLRDQGAELLLISGASAVVDRRDIGPAAVVAAGGEITYFGMPVDPGNLICLGHVQAPREGQRGAIPALVLPGCARSPKMNGFDWVLQRLFAGLPISGRNIAGMGVGGLLKEISLRPMPRAQALAPTAPGAEGEAKPAPRPGSGIRQPRKVAALILAAGLSSRMAPQNKLLVRDTTGVPMVRRVAEQVLASNAGPVLVVTGHMQAEVRQALSGLALRFVEATDYASGLSASLKAGLAAVPEEAEGVLICLGDMPLVAAPMLDQLIACFDPEEGRAIVQPSFGGEGGNPVLFAREFLAEIRAISGDKGARQLLRRHADRVTDVPMDQDGVLRDFDTAEAMRAVPGMMAEG